MNPARPPAGRLRPTPEQATPRQLKLLMRMLALVTAAIVLSGLVLYFLLSTQATRQTGTALTTLAESGAWSIARWHGDLLAHARHLQTDPLLAQAMAGADSEQGLAALRAWMRVQRDAFGYRQIFILDANLNPLAVDPRQDADHPQDPRLDAKRAALARAALADGEPRLTHLHENLPARDSDTINAPHFDFIVPLPARPVNPRPLVAGLILHVDPSLSISPILDRLSRSDMGSQLLLLENGPTGLQLVNPLPKESVPERDAADRELLLARLQEVFVPGAIEPSAPRRIATNEPVYAAVHETTNPAWRVVALMPASRFERAARRVGQVVLVITILTLAAAATGIGLVWWRQRWLRMQDQLHWAAALEAERNELEKLGAVGRLSAGVAHELNNPLMGIINAIEFCIDMTEADDGCRQALTDAERHTRRCIDIVQGLLSLTHGGDGHEDAPRPVDALALVRKVQGLLAYRLRDEQVRVDIDASDDLRPVRLRANDFEQVTINLVTNALDAVETCSRKWIRIGLALRGDDFVFTVQDSGIGISDENKALIFEPFFTTKPIGRGTGLGLSTTWAIVTGLGGKLWVESERGKGTRMTVIFPRAATLHTAADCEEATA